MMALAIVAAFLAGAGIAQCLIGFAAVRKFAGAVYARQTRATPWPPVSVLKPLCGNEPLLEQALESCFKQDYPHYQIIFGIQDPNDPALPIVEILRQRYPDQEVQLVIDTTMHGSNRKISNLINMLPFAQHEILVISDSDLHLPNSYLARLVDILEQPETGMVTSLYVGAAAPASGWAAALGATQINHHFLPGVLLSRQMGRQDCLGSTVMFTRDTLLRTGGFLPLVQVLAEDNVFGQRVKDLGLSIGLVDIIPAATVPEPCLKSLWQHEIRWTRTIRELAPASLCASLLQYPLFWSPLAIILSDFSRWSLVLFLASWLCRAACAAGIDDALRHRVGRRIEATPLWLFPLRDILSVVEIAACFWVNEVTWRGHKMDASGIATSPVADACRGRQGAKTH